MSNRDIQNKDIAEESYNAMWEAGEQVAEMRREDRYSDFLEFGPWKFFGGDRLFKWVNRWVMEVEYDGFRYAMSIGGHVQDFKDITGIDIHAYEMTKEQQVTRMIEYVTKRAEKFVDSTGHKLSEALSR